MEYYIYYIKRKNYDLWTRIFFLTICCGNLAPAAHITHTQKLRLQIIRLISDKSLWAHDRQYITQSWAWWQSPPTRGREHCRARTATSTTTPGWYCAEKRIIPSISSFITKILIIHYHLLFLFQSQLRPGGRLPLQTRAPCSEQRNRLHLLEGECLSRITSRNMGPKRQYQ